MRFGTPFGMAMGRHSRWRSGRLSGRRSGPQLGRHCGRNLGRHLDAILAAFRVQFRIPIGMPFGMSFRMSFGMMSFRMPFGTVRFVTIRLFIWLENVNSLFPSHNDKWTVYFVRKLQLFFSFNQPESLSLDNLVYLCLWLTFSLNSFTAHSFWHILFILHGNHS